MRRAKWLFCLSIATCAALVLRVALAQNGPEICYTGIDPYYAMMDVPSMVHATHAPDVAVIRSNIIGYLWKAKGWPATNMPASVATVPTTNWVYALGTNVGRVDRLDIAMDYSMHAFAYHIHAARSCNRLLLYHNGHDVSFADDEDNMVRTLRLFLNEGHDVMIFCLPLCGGNSTSAFDVPGDWPLEVSLTEDCYGSVQGHDRMGIILENGQGSFIRFFLEPVVVALNYVQAYYSYRDINMVGISGGGWATHMCAAIDPRISYSFPTAGSLPLYLRVGECSTGYNDAEQIWAPLFENTASWLDVYVLGAFGEGRQQVHILNQYDSCCFSGVQYKTYEPFVTNLVASLGAGDYRVYMDMGQTSHTISDSVLTNVIRPTINSKVLIPAPQFTEPFASSITTTSAVLAAQLTGVAADVSVCWDTSDKGVNPEAWAHTCAYPKCCRWNHPQQPGHSVGARWHELLPLLCHQRHIRDLGLVRCLPVQDRPSAPAADQLQLWDENHLQGLHRQRRVDELPGGACPEQQPQRQRLQLCRLCLRLRRRPAVCGGRWPDAIEL